MFEYNGTPVVKILPEIIVSNYLTIKESCEKKVPFISVIIPTFNREKEVVRSIDSVLMQSFNNFEIIIIDDASTDDTLGVLSQYDDRRISIYRHSSNSGVSCARNLGIKKSKSKLIAFLDSDDEWLPEKLSSQVDLIRVAPSSIGMIYGGVENVKDTGSSFFQPNAKGDVFKQMLNANHLHGACSNALIRKEVFEKVGGFDPLYPAIEDYEMWLRVCQCYKVDYTKKVLHRYFDLQGPSPLVERVSQRNYENIVARIMLYKRWKEDMQEFSGDFLYETAKRSVLSAGIGRLISAKILFYSISQNVFNPRLYILFFLMILPRKFLNFWREVLRF